MEDERSEESVCVLALRVVNMVVQWLKLLVQIVKRRTHTYPMDTYPMDTVSSVFQNLGI